MLIAGGADEPKSHHYLPQTYQGPWCSSSGTVSVRRRGSARLFETGTVAVGAERHLYGKGVEALWRERNFGLLESRWPGLRKELTTTGHVHGQNRAMVATFMALQVARTREHLARTTLVAQLADFADERPISHDKLRAFLKTKLRHDADDTEVEAASALVNYELTLGEPTVDEAFSISMDVAVRQIAPLFENLNWRVETVDQPVLWTSDRPVMPWRPPSERDSLEGVGYGDCDEVRMPLSPTAMLIAERGYSGSPKRVPLSKFHEYNNDIARQCYEFSVCNPGRTGRLQKLALAEHRPAVRCHKLEPLSKYINNPKLNDMANVNVSDC